MSSTRPLRRRAGAVLLAVLASSTPAVADSDDKGPDSVELPGAEIIVITESRRERPLAETTVATEVIRREAIERSGADNLAELLEHHPGIDVFRSFRGAAIRMQGLDPDYVLVLVDGQRAIGRTGGALDLARFPVENIERVEIVKGASSALYGSDALAGVVNIITRKGDRPTLAELRASYGSFSSLDLSSRLGTRRGGFGTLTTAGWHESDGYDLDPGTMATTMSANRQLNIANRTSYRFDRRLELVARSEYVRRDQHGIDESASGAVFDRTSFTEVASAWLQTTWRPTRAGTLSASGHYSLWRDQYLSDQRGSDALDRYELSREQLAEANVKYDRGLAHGHFVSAGAEGMAQFLHADRLDDDGARYRVAVFGQYEWTIADTPYLVTAPGLRLDMDSQFGRYLSPKLATRWDIRDGWRLRAGYGWGFRAPGFRELLLRFENPSVGYRVQGNPDLDPETSRSANLGLEARLHRRAWASVNVFHNDIDNMIAVDLVDEGGATGSQVFGYVNIASARTRGLEVLARLQVTNDLRVELGYTLTDTLDRQTGSVLPGRARHRATFNAVYRFAPAHLELSLRGSVTGRRTFFSGDTPMTAAPYASVGGRAQVRLSRRLDLFAGVHNALDAGDAQLLPIPPRAFFGGLTARY